MNQKIEGKSEKIGRQGGWGWERLEWGGEGKEARAMHSKLFIQELEGKQLEGRRRIVGKRRREKDEKKGGRGGEMVGGRVVGDGMEGGEGREEREGMDREGEGMKRKGKQAGERGRGEKVKGRGWTERGEGRKEGMKRKGKHTGEWGWRGRRDRGCRGSEKGKGRGRREDRGGRRRS